MRKLRLSDVKDLPFSKAELKFFIMFPHNLVVISIKALLDKNR